MSSENGNSGPWPRARDDCLRHFKEWIDDGNNPHEPIRSLGISPLTLAVRRKEFECVRELLRVHKCDPNQSADGGGRTPLWVAADNHCPGRIVTELLIAGASPGHAVREGESPVIFHFINMGEGML